ncbi:MAG: arginine--tRNA ligase [Gammaproteobacteria bacterium]|jgi:arginyl-tRNA synthetase
MKQHLQQLITDAIKQLQTDNQLPANLPLNIQIQRTRDTKHGDYACNIALILAKSTKMPPTKLAELIVKQLPISPQVIKTTIAGPGFINFFIDESAQQSIIAQILNEKARFGAVNIGQGQKVHIEYVSANPTGPLHVGHGRGAAYGSSVANILSFTGYEVHREYYVNDAGRQMDILCISVWLRYLEACGEKIFFPLKGYQGHYVRDLARELKHQYGDKFQKQTKIIFEGIPTESKNDKASQEQRVDAIVARAKKLLDENYEIVFQFGKNRILDEIRDDLAEFDVIFDNWFSEQSLVQNKSIDQSLTVLQQNGYTFEKNGALWFNSIKFGDEKDRVLVRNNGQTTYFASDVAYHWNKLDRGYQIIIDVLGADHHGYVPRIRASMQALKLNYTAFNIPLVQFAVLYRHGKKVQMSTRSGEFVTLRQLRDEVGNDAARFFYVMRRAEQHMDFDLDLAKSRTNENPVYYIQYAHARICSVFRQLTDKDLTFEENIGLQNLNILDAAQEKSLCTILNRYPETITRAAEKLEPHLIANYLRELANAFHIYYNAQQFIVNDTKLRNARLCLISATKQVLIIGLNLLGVSAPEQM